ncbi:hypothetical protein KRP22_006385 [Phytophthora ramorum]|uniref:uncharacterized protein n=1 Tax=Phytophthora ramorum TaxID=164328 RepID=UPI0030A2794B|nr:hypothetical protein KRP23_4275 [Phytophthora ramorum]KAH7507380.1 hypothetical protein KRP22_2482 [Phytophthora ramorum]
MKIFALAFTIAVANAVTADNSTSCYEPCEGYDEYCESTTGLCRGPEYDGECFNAAIGKYQDGCDSGFECIYNKCDYAVANEADEEDEDYSDSGSDSEAGCPVECDVSREYCDSSIGECRAASNDTECYNATAVLFQDGCDAGYDCIDDLCRVASSNSADNRTCSLICSAGKFCENDTTKCRGPAFGGECFNLETGIFQDGCDEGYFCSFNKCVDVSLGA